jgi:lipoyl(octanoyl) transferase
VSRRPAALAVTERVGYAQAWEWQRRLADARREGRIPDVIWLLEHDPVYTYGRHGSRSDLFLDDGALAALGATCLRTDRGGQMTWHGPGQSVGYAIVDLRPGGAVRRFVDALVGAMGDAAREAGVNGAAAGRTATGLYVSGRKLGSVGIRVSGGVTMHGLALNRDPDPAWFARMTACGAPGVPATSIRAEGGDPNRRRVDAALAAALAERLGARLEPVALDDLLTAAARRAA